MDNAIVISPLVAVIISVAAGFVATVFGWFAKGYLKRMDRDRTESNARMDRDRTESNARMESLKAELTKQMESLKAELTKQMESLKAELTKQMESDKAELTKQMESDKAELIERIRQSDARNEKAHSETRAVLHDLNARVGRLEGARNAKDGSTGGSGQHSPRRNDDPSAAPAGEAEPAQGAERLDRSMLPLAGVGAEPEHSAGLAHQAVPDQESDDESGAEPNAEESPDTAQ